MLFAFLSKWKKLLYLVKALHVVVSSSNMRWNYRVIFPLLQLLLKFMQTFSSRKHAALAVLLQRLACKYCEANKSVLEQAPFSLMPKLIVHFFVKLFNHKVIIKFDSHSTILTEVFRLEIICLCFEIKTQYFVVLSHALRWNTLGSEIALGNISCTTNTNFFRLFF